MQEPAIPLLEIHRHEMQGRGPIVEVAEQLEPVIEAAGQQQKPLEVQRESLVLAKMVRVGHVFELDA